MGGEAIWAPAFAGVTGRGVTAGLTGVEGLAHLIQPLIIPLPIHNVGVVLPSPLPRLFGRPPAQDAAIDASKVWDMAASA